MGALTVASILGGAGAASADGGGCPRGTEADDWRLTTTDQVYDSDIGNKADQNGDGNVCFKINPGSVQRFGLGGVVWIVVDNNGPA